MMTEALPVKVEDSAEQDETGAVIKRNGLTEADWAEAKELYELGTAGLSDLADKFGVSRQALHRRIKDAGLVRGSRAHEVAAAAAAAATSAVSASAAATAERFADRRNDWIEETRLQGVALLKQSRMMAAKVVAENARAGRTPAAIDDDLKALQRYEKILEGNIAAALSLLRADESIDEEDLPSLQIEDLTDQDRLDHFKNIGAMEEDGTIEEMLAEDLDLGEDD